MTLTSYMFINNSSSAINISLTAYETVAIYEMQTSGNIEVQVDTQSIGGGSSVTWTMRVPAGGISGLGVYNGLSYTNPDPTNLVILTTEDKNPWPTPPPPPPPAFTDVRDFEDRYEGFLSTLATKVKRPEQAA